MNICPEIKSKAVLQCIQEKSGAHSESSELLSPTIIRNFNEDIHFDDVFDEDRMDMMDVKSNDS